MNLNSNERNVHMESHVYHITYVIQTYQTVSEL
jgi:hypothetical protein